MATIKAGLIVDWEGTAYNKAEVLKVAANGYCKCKWPDGHTFNARANWLAGKTEPYTIVVG